MTLTGGGEPERVPVKMMSASSSRCLAWPSTPAAALPTQTTARAQKGSRCSAQDSPRAVRRDRGGGAVAPARQPLIHRRWRAPRHFELFQPADVYVPFGPWAATLPDDRGWHPGILPIARLKPGVSIEEARVEMDAIARQLEAEFSDSNTNVRVLVSRAQDQLVQNVRPALLMLSAPCSSCS